MTAIQSGILVAPISRASRQGGNSAVLVLDIGDTCLGSSATASRGRMLGHAAAHVQRPNTYADPEALDVVLGMDVPVRMVGLNLTHQALATPAVVERMRAMNHVVGRVRAEWMGFFGSSYNRIWEFDAPPVHDPCTVAALIDPDVIEWREAFVAVELEGRWTRGATVVDLHHRYPDHAANAQVAMKLDARRYWDLVLDAVDVLGQTS